MKLLFSNKYSETTVAIALFMLRAASGVLMIPHGYMKIQNFAKFSPGFIDPFHVGSNLSLSLTIFAELFCSVLIIVGLFTRLAAIPLIITMCVALFIAHHGELFGDGEHSALFLAIFLTVLIMGPGKYSLDRMIRK